MLNVENLKKMKENMKRITNQLSRDNLIYYSSVLPYVFLCRHTFFFHINWGKKYIMLYHDVWLDTIPQVLFMSFKTLMSFLNNWIIFHCMGQNVLKILDSMNGPEINISMHKVAVIFQVISSEWIWGEWPWAFIYLPNYLSTHYFFSWL